MIKEIREVKISADDKELADRLKKNNFEADEEFLAEFKKKFLKCDAIRAGLPEYEYLEEILFNPQLGHWELWDYNESIDSDIVVKFPRPVYARDPKDDIVKNWVGIDFGYKSLAVSYKDNECRKIIPINVGKVWDISDLKDYENPTVMYFIDFDKFLKDYNSKEGRPDTSWEDLNISYSASDALKNATKENYFSFLTDLKSWCSFHDIVRLKPLKNNRLVEFKPFLEIGDDDPNPLEYYAYFLGLYINNMHRRKIFMRYKMSFPVYFEKELRKKIVDSFAKGIKKSFPAALLRDEKVMSQFKVVEGFEEPVAYALTALEKYNFKPTADEEFYYSVFDFGSSCTDFDFGVYCGIKDSEDDYIDEDKDYRLIHFGANSYRNLGGEKLLKYLAFEIFKINTDKLFNDGNGNKIQFTTYDGCSSSEYIGFESLINNQSVYAKRNMYNLMEKLRWAWEGVKTKEDEETQEDYDHRSIIFVDLLNEKGEPILGYLSNCTYSEEGEQIFVNLQELLRKRIDKAVGLFFESMRIAFKDGVDDKRYDIKPLKDISVINIFLAGNSSKSKLFLEILDDYILGGKAKKILGLDENSPLKFVIFPLLGTDEAIEIQKERGYNVNIDDKTEPNGDRAISYGLLIEGIDVKTVCK